MIEIGQKLVDLSDYKAFCAEQTERMISTINYKYTSTIYRNELIVYGFLHQVLDSMDVELPNDIYNLLLNWYGDTNMRAIAKNIAKQSCKYVCHYRRRESLTEKLLLTDDHITKSSDESNNNQGMVLID